MHPLLRLVLTAVVGYYARQSSPSFTTKNINNPINSPDSISPWGVGGKRFGLGVFLILVLGHHLLRGLQGQGYIPNTLHVRHRLGVERQPHRVRQPLASSGTNYRGKRRAKVSKVR